MRDYSFLLILVLGLPSLVDVDYSQRVYYLFGQLIVIQLIVNLTSRHKYGYNFINILFFSTAFFIIFFSNFAGYLSDRSSIGLTDLSDLAPLSVLFLIVPISSRMLSIILFVSNLLAITLNIAKLTLLNSDFLTPFFELYRISENFDENYWRFTGLAGQPGQTGLHGLLTFLFVYRLKVRMSTFERVIALLAIVNVIFSGSRISLLLMVFYAFVLFILSISRIKIIALSCLLAFLSFVPMKSFLTDDVYEQRIANVETGGFRLKLLSASADFALKTFPIGYGGQKEYLGIYGDIGYYDLSLRNPDSSMALILVRYGFLGLVLLGFFIFVKLVIAFDKNKSFFYGLSTLVLFALLDPVFTVPLNVFLLGQYFKHNQYDY